MLFNSLDFFFFLIPVYFVYILVPRSYVWTLLLGASLYFYANWNPVFLPVLLTSILIDFTCAIQMERRPTLKSLWLAISIIGNLSMLISFRYLVVAQYFLPNQGVVSSGLNPLIPLGISFYTLQTVGYSIDVYRGKKTAESHLGRFALFVSFFPQLLSGPIERSQKLLPQFQSFGEARWADFQLGILLILKGLYIKLVIADNLSGVVDVVFAAPSQFKGYIVWLTCYTAMLVVYADFHGYTETARGVARLFGIDISRNFERPLLAPNIRAFWQRWHITLTKWLVDYIYIPLARGASKAWQRKLYMVLVFVLIGLWHSASWNLLFFGAYHGALFLLYDKWILVSRTGWPRLARSKMRSFGGGLIPIAITSIFVAPSAAFFIAENMAAAESVLSRLVNFSATPFTDKNQNIPIRDCISAVIGLLLYGLFSRTYSSRTTIANPAFLGLCATIMMIILTIGKLSGKSFIYFQF